MGKRFFAIACFLSAVGLAAIWGCSGSHGSNGFDPSGGDTGVIVVGPNPTSSSSGTGTTSTGSTGGTTSTGGPGPTTSTGGPNPTTTGRPTTTTSGTSSTGGPTTGYIGGASTTGGPTTGPGTSGTGATSTSTTGTGTTGGNNVTQIPVTNSAGSFPYQFTSPITVPSGSMVDWVNQTSVQHGITWDQQSPSSSPPPGANIAIFNGGTTSASWRVPTVAAQTTYNYHCTVHGNSMSGQIIVTP